MKYDPIESYRRLYLIRHVEEEIARRYYPDPQDKSKSPMRCPVHLSIGQEGVAVGVAMAVPKGTHAYSTHRNHAHYLAWGGNVDAMVAELYGRGTGCSGGRAGSMHLHDESVGFMGTSAIVGSSVSLAVGDAFAARMGGSDRITVAFGGDAVLETGQFWEALNFARLNKLRILFVIEDNGLATATPKNKRQATGYQVDACYATESDTAQHVFEDVTGELQSAHAWPHILIIPTRRFYVHVGTERMPEYATYPDDDPVAIGAGEVWDGEKDRKAIKGRVALAFERAEAAPWPT